MEKLFIPTLHTFAMNNIFTGSQGLFRFRAAPEIIMATPKEVDYEKSTIHAEYWHGLYCYEKKIFYIDMFSICVMLSFIIIQERRY